MTDATTAKPIVIGVTGGTASGKTTVSHAIFDHFADDSVLLLAQDAYYNDQSDMTIEQRRAVNYDHPLAFDTPRLIADLKKLLHYQAVEVPVYDYKILNRSDKVIVQQPRDVIILEGILILDDPKLRDLMDIKVFVDTDDDVRVIRRIQRDIRERGRTLDNVIDQYLTTVKPMYHQFVEPTKRYADLIVPEGGQNQVAIDLLVTKVRAILTARGK
ncbi:uridine kinase [Loigolactobacillus rennini]|uniref:Uridine kinase n=2 Tax=Loigolactobacillus rennini TaxID=238013 RepID=A0A0R2D1G4_9LACO|nr:uridine kinase [Loigolactobacillus rennini]KRM97767.1 uridine cytidine kinase [Loigolactobacillus rennini DSM 20253]SFZ88244.1 Uridine kinase [C1] [Loigolactobacillus rennini]